MNSDKENNQKGSLDKKTIEAKDWLLHINSNSATPETLAEFKAWSSTAPENKAEFALMKTIWDGSVVLKDHPVAVELRQNRQREKFHQKWFAKHRFGFPTIRTLAIAVTVLLAVCGLWLTQTDTMKQTTYLTATGEQKEVFLSDGSKVFLDSETKINTLLSQNMRQIELTEGRATFTVAHDPDRPFVVSAGKIHIHALGTVFNVNKIFDGKVIVAVSEGEVKISKKQETERLGEKTTINFGKKPDKQKILIASKTEKATGATHEILRPGQEIVVDEYENAYKIETVDFEQTNMWLEGRLYFQKAPLPDVIKEINRYLDNKIIIGDSLLKDRTISLSLKIKNSNDFLYALGKIIPITSQNNANGQVIISQLTKPNKGL